MTNDITRRVDRQGATKAQSHLNRGTGVRIPTPHTPPGARGKSWTSAGVAEGGPRPGQEKIEQHDKDNYEKYDTENALSRRQLRRRKR